MKRNRPKPWEWYLSAALLAAGVVLIFIAWSKPARVLIAVGAGALIGLAARRRIYLDMPREEQREVDREEQDERNRMLRERASWLCWQGELVLFFVGTLFLILFTEIKMSIIYLLFALEFVRWLIYETVRRWLDRKY